MLARKGYDACPPRCSLPNPLLSACPTHSFAAACVCPPPPPAQRHVRAGFGAEHGGEGGHTGFVPHWPCHRDTAQTPNCASAPFNAHTRPAGREERPLQVSQHPSGVGAAAGVQRGVGLAVRRRREDGRVHLHGGGTDGGRCSDVTRAPYGAGGSRVKQAAKPGAHRVQRGCGGGVLHDPTGQGRSYGLRLTVARAWKLE
jgi:hypothetical protein